MTRFEPLALAVLLALGCASDPPATADAGTADVAADLGNALDASAPDAPDVPRACIPGAQVACACLGGGAGVQVCNPDGTALGACACPDAGTPVDVAEAVDAGPPDVGFDVPDVPVDVGTDSGIDRRCDSATLPNFCMLGASSTGASRMNFCTDILNDRYNCGGCARVSCVGPTHCERGACVRD